MRSLPFSIQYSSRGCVSLNSRLNLVCKRSKESEVLRNCNVGPLGLAFKLVLV